MPILKWFSQDYSELQRSRQHSLQILRILQLSLSATAIILMIIAFPFQQLPWHFYAITPSFLVLNYVICSFLLSRGDPSYVYSYLIILQFLLPALILELLLSVGSKFKADSSLLIGVQGGLFYSIPFVNQLPSFVTLGLSILYLLHMILRQYMLSTENIEIGSLIILCSFLFMNFIYYHKERLNLEDCSSQRADKQSLQQFQNLLNLFPNQLVIVDENSFTRDWALYLNEKARDLQEALLGSCSRSLNRFLESFPLEKISIEQSEATLKEEIQSLFKNKKTERAESKLALSKIQYVIKHRWGEVLQREEEKTESVEFEISIGKITWNRNDAFVIIFSDTSKSEKIKQLKMLDHNKDNVLATVSHELRTPLNGILGMIDIAEEETPAELAGVINCLEVARNSGKALLFLVNDMLDFSQIKKGTLRLNFQRVKLRELLDKIVPLVQVQLRTKSIDFFYEFDCPEDALVFVDPLRVQQVLVNLLGNAAKFTTKGSIKLSAKICALKEPAVEDAPSYSERFKSEDFAFYNSSNDFVMHNEQYVEICVEDTGRGIPEEKQEKLFKYYGRLEQEGNPTGVGLGLAISQSLVKQMDSGGIKVESKVGQGSKFFFKLKVISESEETNSRNALEERTGKISIKNFGELTRIHSEDAERFNENIRILLAEDDQANHLIIQHYLKSKFPGITLDQAFNGEEALKKVEETVERGLTYDLIFMDCQMPIMGGIQASRRLTDQMRQNLIPPMRIVALTGNSSAQERKICLENGMSEVWTKPISKGEFLTRTSESLARKGLYYHKPVWRENVNSANK